MDEKKEYKYFGALTVIEETAKLDHLGQSVKLEESFARHIAEHGGACILPADTFDSIGFTSDEIQAFPTPADAYNAPEAFQHKRDRAYALRLEWLADKSGKTE